MHLDALRILAEIPHGATTTVGKLLREDESMSNQDIAQRVIEGLSEPQIWAIANSALIIEAARQRRGLVRAREQDAASATSRYHVRSNRLAERATALTARVTRLGLPPESTASDCLDAELKAMRESMDRRERAIHLSADLLESSFATGGVMVNWGDATVDQHRRRAATLYRGARGMIETAKLHEDAVAMLTEAGMSSLRELLSAARGAA